MSSKDNKYKLLEGSKEKKSFPSIFHKSESQNSIALVRTPQNIHLKQTIKHHYWNIQKKKGKKYGGNNVQTSFYRTCMIF